MRERICLIGTGGCCAPIGDEVLPARLMPPISTLMGFIVPSGWRTGTVPTTGEGGRPPPVNTPERGPPHRPPLPITPEALSRFTAYPFAPPRLVPHGAPSGASAWLVLKN